MTSTSNTTFWQNAYQQHAPKLLGLCRRYVSELSVAQDLMHDAFITAINKQDTYTNKGSFEGWLSRIAVNTVLMHLRKEKKWTQSIDDVDVSDDWDDDSDEPKDTKSLILHCGFGQEDLLLAIDQLPLHHKTVFNLYVFENYSHQQIADSLHISAGTSKSHLARARKKIQDILLQKAIEMNKKDRKAAIVPFFVSDDNFIDELYKNELGDFQLTPPNAPPGLEALMNSAAPVPAPPATWFGFAKAKFMSITLVSVLGIATVTYFLPSNNKPNNIVQVTDNQDTIKRESTPKVVATEENKNIVTIDTSPKKPRKVKAKEKKVTAPIVEIPEKQTIIVKKQVIKKDTIRK